MKVLILKPMFLRTPAGEPVGKLTIGDIVQLPPALASYLITLGMAELCKEEVPS